MGDIQNDTKKGQLLLNSDEDLTGKEGFLVTRTATGVALPTDEADITPYVVLQGAASGSNSLVRPLCPEQQTRVFAKGTGSAGDVLLAATVSTAADKGKVQSIDSAADDTYFSPGIADEDFVDGQSVLVRPFARTGIVVSS